MFYKVFIYINLNNAYFEIQRQNCSICIPTCVIDIRIQNIINYNEN